MVGLAVMSSGGAGVSAAACTATTCCNVAIPKLDPLTATRIDSSVCSEGTEASSSTVLFRNVLRLCVCSIRVYVEITPREMNPQNSVDLTGPAPHHLRWWGRSYFKNFHNSRGYCFKETSFGV